MNLALTLLKSIVSNLKQPNESLNLSLNNVHHEGLFSLVIDGTEHGKLTRIFIADQTISPFAIQLHTHRYPIVLTAIKGKIVHHTAAVITGRYFGSVNLSNYEYRSALNGGFGMKYINQVNVVLHDYILPHGGQAEMGENDLHTVSCSKGSIWIVEEQGFKTETSRVLGVPFALDNLYTKPEMFQINDKHSLVIRELNKMIQNYELV